MTKQPRPAGGPFMPAILRRLAPRLGAEVLFEPEFEIVGHIRFPNGRHSYFWHNKFNLNSVASARITQDKGHTNFFLQTNGIRVPRTEVFIREAEHRRLRRGQGPNEARRFASELDWQVYLKPLCGSQGDGVMRAGNAKEFDAAAAALFARERKVLVQQACAGRDYRLVVLDGEVISAYERRPLSVCGDGRRTVAALLTARQEEFDATGRDTVLRPEDPRILITLGRRGLDLTHVLPAGEQIALLDVANLSCGGTTTDVTERVHPTVAALAAQIAVVLDLRFAGVDLLIPDAAAPLDDYTVLEVNSAPGLDHYASHGPAHEAHIDELYFKVLQAIERGA